MTLLTVSDLVKTFGTGDTATHVLRGLNLTLDKGEMAALLGPSGSGKSTLLTILGTLMQPTSGAHQMLGVDLIRATDAALTTFRNEHIGFVFQFHNLLPDFTALENAGNRFRELNATCQIAGWIGNLGIVQNCTRWAILPRDLSFGILDNAFRYFIFHTWWTGGNDADSTGR